MVTNTKQDDTSKTAEEDEATKETNKSEEAGTTVTDEDFKKLKEEVEVETSKEADETTETKESEDESEETGEDESENEASTFVKEFPNIKGDTPEEYAKNLEEAYKNSSSEALRLKKLSEESQTEETEESEEADLSNPISLYMKQKMDEEITTAFEDFKKTYPMVNDPTAYNQFTREVATLSQTILTSQKRLAAPKELYTKAAVILGWEAEGKVDDKEKLSAAVKNQAATSKTTSATKPKSKQSTVTDTQVLLFKKLNPSSDKTDAQIREELEPFN